MLKNCPECNGLVSDKADFCPHCGYKEAKIRSPAKKRNKHVRLPNGFGRITKLNNPNLRNKYRVMVTVGRDEEGRYLAKLLKPKAYFATYNEAYEALVEYHKDPTDLMNDMTVKELYEKWLEEYVKHSNNKSARSAMNATFKYCSSIYDMRVVDIRTRHLKTCIEEGSVPVKGEKNKGKVKTASDVTKKKIKILFNMLFDYAVEYEIMDKNYARTFGVSKPGITNSSDTAHVPFNSDEIKVILKNIPNVPYADAILIQCYTGLRPQELVSIKVADVNLSDWFITGGMKTKAGTGRLVPIHPAIRELVKKRYDAARSINSEMFFSENGESIPYVKYWSRFRRAISIMKLDPNHKPHDPRTTFATMAKKYDMNEYILKLILGHAITDITEKYYTRRSPEDLMNEILKLPNPDVLVVYS